MNSYSVKDMSRELLLSYRRSTFTSTTKRLPFIHQERTLAIKANQFLYRSGLNRQVIIVVVVVVVVISTARKAF